MQAIVLVGGQATRLRPLTLEMPKALIQLQGKAILEHVLDGLHRQGVSDIILSVGYLQDQIIEHFGDGSTFGYSVSYIKEDQPLGTAGPMRMLEQKPTESFIVCNGDELKEVDVAAMLAEHKENGGVATLGLLEVEDPSAYGVARIEDRKILEFVEKPKKQDAPSNLINAGFYIMEPEVFEYIPAAGKAMFEYDVFPKLAAEGKLFGHRLTGQWFDTGTPQRLEYAEKHWKGFV